jgi:carnitine 3-dehydrogenase
MMIHVNLNTRSACEPENAVKQAVDDYASRHAGLPKPDGAGRAIG